MVPPPVAAPATPALPQQVELAIAQLSQATVQMVASDHAAQLSQVRGRRELHGDIAVTFQIDGNGKVVKSQLSSSIKNPKVAGCILGPSQSWKFPKPPTGAAKGMYSIVPVSVPAWSGVVESGAMDLSFTEEQDALVQTAREFTRKEIIPRAAHFDETGEFPREIFKKAWETGLMNVEIPEAYGGLGGSCLDNCLVQEEVSFGCSGINTSMAANSLGATPLLVAGTEEQKKKYLSRLTARAHVLPRTAAASPTPAATSPACARASRSTATTTCSTARSAGSRTAASPSFYTVFATFDPAMKHKGIACFVVDANTPGVQGGPQGEQDGPARLEHHRRHLRGRARSTKSAARRHRGRRLQGRDEDVRPLAPVDRGDARPA